MPEPDPFRDFTSWAGGWDLETQLPRQASREPALPPLPGKWGPRRPGDHAWDGPDGSCPDCGVASFLDATGPCTYGMEPRQAGRASGWAVWDGAAPGNTRDRHRHARGVDSFREHTHPGGWTPHDHPPAGTAP
jgi:hypothetical protein